MKNRKIVSIFPPEVKPCWGYFAIRTAVYPALSTYNTEFVALAVGTMKLVEWEFLLCGWWSFGPQHSFWAVLIETTLFMGAGYLTKTIR